MFKFHQNFSCNPLCVCLEYILSFNYNPKQKKIHAYEKLAGDQGS